jgi:hypothetical protein
LVTIATNTGLPTIGCYATSTVCYHARNRTGVVSVSMECCIVTTAFGRTRHNIIVLNVHASTRDKIDDVKDSFYEELERIFNKFPKYRMKILLGD